MSETDYFEYFQLPFSLQIDQDLLRKKYHQNSRKYHPDFHTQSDQAMQLEMLEESAVNNKGYKTLSDFDALLLYVLRLKEVMKEEGQNKIPQEFLMEMMDLNEALMEAKMDDDPNTKKKLEDEIEALQTNIESAVKDLITVPDLDALTADQWQQLLDYHLKRRYLKRLGENMSG